MHTAWTRRGRLWQQCNAIPLFSATVLRQSRMIDSLVVLIRFHVKDVFRGGQRSDMLDGKRYFSEFPDEDPDREQALLHTRRLLQTLRALEKELRPHIPRPVETSADADDS